VRLSVGYPLLMIASTPKAESERRSNRYPDLLENGAHHSASEFLRRYEAMAEVQKAELINGIVYTASPVRVDQHGEPDSLLQTWLCNYSIGTPAVKSATNSTTRLGPDDVPQPDGLLRILPEYGGQSRLDAKGYLQGAPELVVEVAASTTSLDAREKYISYRRAGAREYLLWRTADEAVDWWLLQDDEYRPLVPDAKGILHSHVFPGLWLDVTALLSGDGATVMGTLQQGLISSEHAEFLARLKPQATTFRPT
jgi:Uma2 family endonuclease